MAAPPRPKMPDLRPARDYGPLFPGSLASTRWLGFATGAAALLDPFVSFHEVRPWSTTPWRDRFYLAHDLWRGFDLVDIPGAPHHPGQGHLFDPDDVNGK
jgi:hypothetical protein